MGKTVRIDHRPAPRSKGVPKILKQGRLEDAHPEPEVPTDEVVQLRKQVTEQRGEIERLETAVSVKTAETKQLKQSLQHARDETARAHEEAQQPELEGTIPSCIEIVTVDDIQRDQDNATLTVLADLDGTIGETLVRLPVDQIIAMIRKKKQDGKPTDG